MAGANAIFTGDAMLTTPCSFLLPEFILWTYPCILPEGTPWDQDKAMLENWGLSGMKPFDQASVKLKERFPVDIPSPTMSATSASANPVDA